uniref:Uncharacterized protein n=1 Tax=Arundo donax TaxID=35708 RepID=A0A0A9BUG0_ARUDO
MRHTTTPHSATATSSASLVTRTRHGMPHAIWTVANSSSQMQGS